MSFLKEGERVVVVGDEWAYPSNIGKMGKIARVATEDQTMPYFVEFDDGGDDWVGYRDIVLVSEENIRNRVSELEERVAILEKLLKEK